MLTFAGGQTTTLSYDLTGSTYNASGAPDASKGHLSKIEDSSGIPCYWAGTYAVEIVVAAEIAALVATGTPSPSSNVASGVSGAARNMTTYGVLFEAPVAGLTRNAHRAAANSCLARELVKDAEFAAQLNKELGINVLQQMQSGRKLLNPAGTVWHHPANNPLAVQLLQRSEHTSSALQPILHPLGIGGYGIFYGGK